MLLRRELSEEPVKMRIRTQWVWGGVSCLSYKLPGNIKAANPEYHALRARMQNGKLQEISGFPCSKLHGRGNNNK